MIWTRRIPSVPLLLALALLAACNKEETPVTPNPEGKSGTGRLFTTDGKPAAYATVRIYKVDEIPQPLAAAKIAGSGAVLVTRTDAEGRYSAEDLPAGEYNILSEADGNYAYQDSLGLGAGSGPIPPDTLQSPGTVRGYVKVEPQHDPRTVTVQLLGTSRFVNLDASGRFEFKDLADGAYTMRLLANLPEYTPTFAGLRATAGKEADLKDTLKLIYTGIPIVRGLKAVYDTAKGSARITWDRPTYSGHSEFLVYRDPAGSTLLSQSPIVRTADTVIEDELYRNGVLLGNPGFSSNAFRYRVRSVNQSETAGPLFGYVQVEAAAPSLVKTLVSVRLADKQGMSVTIRDSSRVVFSWTNPTRKIATVNWLDPETRRPFRSVAPLSKAGYDTLPHVAGDTKSISNMVVRSVDDAGTAVEIPVYIRVENDTPTVVLLPSSKSARMNDSLRLTATAQDLGRITGYEWDIGNTGIFTRSNRPDTLFAVPEVPPASGTFVSRVRVTDEDGNFRVMETVTTVLPWRSLRSLPYPLYGAAAAVLGGKIYVAGGIKDNYSSNALLMYDPVSDTWRELAAMPTPRAYLALEVQGNRLLALGGLHTFPGGSNTYAVVEAYSPENDRWEKLPDIHNRMTGFKTFAMGGKIYIPMGETDPLRWSFSVLDGLATDWSLLKMDDDTQFFGDGAFPKFPAGNPSGYVSAVVGNRGYLVGGSLDNISKSGVLFELGFTEGFVRRHMLPLETMRNWSASGLVDEYIYVTGGEGETAMDKVIAYHPGNNEWFRKSQMVLPRYQHTAAVFDGKLFLIGGLSPGAIPLKAVETYHPSLDGTLRKIP